MTTLSILHPDLWYAIKLILGFIGAAWVLLLISEYHSHKDSYKNNVPLPEPSQESVYFRIVPKQFIWVDGELEEIVLN